MRDACRAAHRWAGQTSPRNGACRLYVARSAPHAGCLPAGYVSRVWLHPELPSPAWAGRPQRCRQAGTCSAKDTTCSVRSWPPRRQHPCCSWPLQHKGAPCPIGMQTVHTPLDRRPTTPLQLAHLMPGLTSCSISSCVICLLTRLSVSLPCLLNLSSLMEKPRLTLQSNASTAAAEGCRSPWRLAGQAGRNAHCVQPLDVKQ